MKREEIKAIFPEATAEQLQAVMDLYGADVEKNKGKVAALEADLKAKKDALEKLDGEFSALKTSNATAEDWKKKYDDLTADVAKREAAAKADADAKEKAERIEKRFAGVVGDKRWSHDAIRKEYLQKFTAALDDDAYSGRSDAEILHELTKDDKAAFVGVQAFPLVGATVKSDNAPKSKDEILAIKDGTQRRAAMADALKADPHFFE